MKSKCRRIAIGCQSLVNLWQSSPGKSLSQICLLFSKIAKTLRIRTEIWPKLKVAWWIYALCVIETTFGKDFHFTVCLFRFRSKFIFSSKWTFNQEKLFWRIFRETMSSIWRKSAFQICTWIVAIWRIFRQIVSIATKTVYLVYLWFILTEKFAFQNRGVSLYKTIQNFPNLQFGYTDKKPVLLAATIKIVPLPRKRNQLLLLSKGGGGIR